MAEIKRVGSLEIDQDLEQTEREWTLERISWACMALILLAGLLGLLGPGPLSRTVAATAPLRVEYSRFARDGAPFPLQVDVPSGMGQDGMVQVGIRRDYFDKIRVQTIVPEPVQVESSGDTLIFSFAVADPAQPLVVTYYLEAIHFGRVSADVMVEGGPSVHIWQLLYP